MSPGLPARCLDCQYTDPDPGWVFLDDVTNASVTVGGSCPLCNGRMRLLEGRLNVVDGAIQMLSGPEWSWELVEQMRLGLRQAVDRRTDPGTALAMTAPPAARAFNAATAGKSLEFKLAVAGMLLTLLATDYRTVGGNLQGLADAIVAALKYVAQHGQMPLT